MASNNVCSSCLRAMRQQARLNIQKAPSRQPTLSRAYQPAQRTFTTNTRNQAEEKPAKRPPPPPPPQPTHEKNIDTPAFQNFAAQLRKSSALRSTTEPYIAYGGTEDLFQECSRQCSYTIPSALETPPAAPPMNEAGDHLGQGSGWWLEPKAKNGLGLEVTFNSWAQVLFLHMWMLTVRFRCFPEKYVKDWHQNLLDHFFYAAEDRMATWHGMAARGTRNKNLKDLWLQWRGVQLGYDEGLIKGDAVLAAAIWRNLFKGNENVDISDVATVTAYVMRELQRLGAMDDTRITEGQVKFSDPKTVAPSLAKESPSMRQHLTAEELKAPQQVKA
ncbi:hypothetical protein PRZ48_006368 [Zasmidium cellare]|uniref:Ubiquinol-cytochrome c chaperone domain-containing protein n=1 Tax=Zasmidium cellare TaxID=395010 RepID=A0ABR0EP69_ZASCE|nr:hypothetical protein PRZ48_006368 [Zasmidium cellare]